MEGVAIRFSFEWTKDDFKAQYDHVLNVPNNVRGLRVVRFLVVFLIFFYMGVYPAVKEGFSLGPWIVPVGLSLLAWFVLPFGLSRWNNWRFEQILKENSQILLGKFKWVVMDDGIRVTSKRSETLLKWEAITRVEEDKNYVFLYIGKTMFNTLPKRVFAKEAKIGEFMRFVQEKAGLKQNGESLVEDLG